MNNTFYRMSEAPCAFARTQKMYSTEGFPFPAYHNRSYYKFCIPDVKKIRNNSLCLMFHSNGIAILSLDKTHAVHELLKNPPTLTQTPSESSHIVTTHVKEAEEYCNALPFGFSLKYDVSRFTAHRTALCSYYKFTHTGDGSLCHPCSMEEFPGMTSTETVPESEALHPPKKAKKSLIQPETTIATLEVTFYYADSTNVIRSYTTYTFPVTPGIPCEIIETNSVILPLDETSESFCPRNPLTTITCPYDVGFMFILNPTWKFRQDVLWEFIEAADRIDDDDFLTGKRYVKMKDHIDESQKSLEKYSHWQIISRKTETDPDAPQLKEARSDGVAG